VRDRFAPRQGAERLVARAPASPEAERIAEKQAAPPPADERDAVDALALSDDARPTFAGEAPAGELFRSDSLAGAAARADEDAAGVPEEQAAEARRHARGHAEQAVPAAPEPLQARTKRSAAQVAPEALAQGAGRDPAPDKAHAMAKTAEATAVWPTVLLDPKVDTVVSVTGPGLLVRVPIPTAALTAGLAEVRVRDRSGTREMREQHFGPPAHAAQIRLPAAWLTPGTYRVELLLGGEDAVAVAWLVITP
jgi:hypothetical protein